MKKRLPLLLMFNLVGHVTSFEDNNLYRVEILFKSQSNIRNRYCQGGFCKARVGKYKGWANNMLETFTRSQQTKSRCDNVVTTLSFGCDNVVITTL